MSQYVHINNFISNVFIIQKNTCPINATLSLLEAILFIFIYCSYNMSFFNYANPLIGKTSHHAENIKNFVGHIKKHQATRRGVHYILWHISHVYISVSRSGNRNHQKQTMVWPRTTQGNKNDHGTWHLFTRIVLKDILSLPRQVLQSERVVMCTWVSSILA